MHAHVYSAAAAAELLSTMWQVLATLTIGGLVIVVLLAFIEPGPVGKETSLSPQTTVTTVGVC